MASGTGWSQSLLLLYLFFLQQHPYFLKCFSFLFSEEECQIAIFYFARCVRKLRYYSEVIHSFVWKSAIEQDGVFKMRDSVPRASYSSVCNVLLNGASRSALLIEYRVYRSRLYDIDI